MKFIRASGKNGFVRIPICSFFFCSVRADGYNLNIAREYVEYGIAICVLCLARDFQME